MAGDPSVFVGLSSTFSLSKVIFKVFGPFGAGTSMVLSAGRPQLSRPSAQVLIGALYDEWPVPFARLDEPNDQEFPWFLGVFGLET